MNGTTASLSTALQSAESGGLRAPRLSCDVCAVRDGPGGAHVLAYTVTRATTDGGFKSTRGYGSIHLCRRCYATTAGTRTRAARQAMRRRPIGVPRRMAAS